MKLVFFDDFKLGVLKGESVVDVSDVVSDIPSVSPQDTLSGLIADFDAYKGGLEKCVAESDGVPVSQVRLRSARAETPQYRLHGRELHGERHALRTRAQEWLQQVA